MATMVALGGCYSGLGAVATGADADSGSGSGADDDSGDDGPPPPDVEQIPTAGLRRLTRHELGNALRDLIGFSSATIDQLPDDSGTPFDNEYEGQFASASLITAVEALADEAAAHIVQTPSVRDDVVGCAPSGPGDADCFMTFLDRFGRRVLRRPLPEEDRVRLMPLLELAEADGDFYVAVAHAAKVLLQDPRFVYRIERGTPVDGEPDVVRLDAWEVATRLSLLLWNSVPDPWLLDQAADGLLETPEDIRGVAEVMLEQPRARQMVDRFHAMWMGYSSMPLEAWQVSDMRAETAALLERVIFDEGRPWADIFIADETFATPRLAAHYGLAGAPADAETGDQTPRWWSYEGTERLGILSHGSFLSAGTIGPDTSPTVRGKDIRERLFCQILEEPQMGVDVDDGIPSDADCKKDRYAEAITGGCLGCHVQMDSIGFGLENYTTDGRFRTHDDGLPQCTIDGEGQLVELAETFNGPGGLGSLLVESGIIEECMIEQVYRFSTGRGEFDDADVAVIERLIDSQASSDIYLPELLLGIVSDPSFAYRRIED